MIVYAKEQVFRSIGCALPQTEQSSSTTTVVPSSGRAVGVSAEPPVWKCLGALVHDLVTRGVSGRGKRVRLQPAFVSKACPPASKPQTVFTLWLAKKALGRRGVPYLDIW